MISLSAVPFVLVGLGLLLLGAALGGALGEKRGRRLAAAPRKIHLGVGWYEMADEEKSAYIKGMLMSLYIEGRCLREMHARDVVGPEALAAWEERTHKLLKDALGEEAANHFREGVEIPKAWRL